MTLRVLCNFSSAPLGLIGFLGTYLLVMVPALLWVLVMVFPGLRGEGLVIRDCLGPELQSGMITRQYYALGSAAGSTGGFAGWCACSRLSRAASELAFHCGRVKRGVTSVGSARREAACFESLRELREQV